MTTLRRVLVARLKQKPVGTMGAKISAKRRSLGGAGEGYSLRVRIRRSVRRIVLLTLLADLVQSFQLDLTAQSARQDGTAYLCRGQLRSRLREALTVFGDRLERAGKERVTLLGTLHTASQVEGIPLQIVWEFPGRLRIESRLRVLLFDGRRLVGAPTRQEEALVETLFYDLPEHFFLGQAHGLATRFLGSRFRLDDGRAPYYTGTYYDVYEVTDAIQLGGPVRLQPKFYYLSSDTLLLERVRYQSNRGSSGPDVEVQIGLWQRGDGQSVPGRIVRLENGKAVFTLTVTSAIIGPAAK